MVSCQALEKPLLTVVLPIYNDLTLWPQTVESVLAQDYSNYKFVILDNGSTDRTRERLVDYKDPRITIIASAPNLKSELMAKILWSVDTKYISQIYSDDIFLPNKLSKSIQALEESDADVCFSNNLFIDNYGCNLKDRDVPPSQFTRDISEMSIYDHLYRFVSAGNTLHPVSMVIRSQAYRDVGGVLPYLHSIGDMVLFTKLLLFKKVTFLKDKLQKIRINSTVDRVNESAPSMINYQRVMGERSRFFDLLNTNEFLGMIGKVFYPELKGVEIPVPMRRWFLSQKLLAIGDPDAKFYGLQCMYRSLDESYKEIEENLISTRGVTVGQFVESIVEKVFVGGAQTISHHEFLRLNDIIEDLKLRYARAAEDFSNQRDAAVYSQLELRGKTAELELARSDFFNVKAYASSLELRLEESERLRVEASGAIGDEGKD
jgi:glycosyltransferase involved in cell wall biosynthesis